LERQCLKRIVELALDGETCYHSAWRNSHSRARSSPFGFRLNWASACASCGLRPGFRKAELAITPEEVAELCRALAEDGEEVDTGV